MKNLKGLFALGLAVLFVAISAIAAFAVPEAEAYASGSFDDANTYISGKITLLTRAVTDDGELTTVGEASEHFVGDVKDYNYFGILVCAPSNTEGYYKVIETNFVLGRPDGKKDTVEIPEDGFILAINGDRGDVFNDVKAKAVVGDYVTISGVDLSEIEIAETGGDLTGATYAIYHDDGTGEESVAEESTGETSETENPATSDATTVLFVVIAAVAASAVVIVRKTTK